MKNNPQKLDTYLGLCAEVYDLSKPHPPEDAYEFYRFYAEKAQGLICEPMCGTGRFLLPLLEEGFEVHGFDASEYMLKRLESKARQKRSNPHVWQGFVEDLSRPERYDLIFIPSGSFCLLMEQETVQLALRIFHNHLTEAGIFLFECETSQAVPALGIWRGSKWLRNDGKRIVLSQCTSLQGNVCSSICKYELVCGNTIIHTEIEELNVRIYEPEELEAILFRAGFSEIRAIKAFDRNSKPSKEDESIIYECRK